MFESAIALVEEHAALEQQMADPTVASTPDRLREVNTRYAALAPVVTASPSPSATRPNAARCGRSSGWSSSR